MTLDRECEALQYFVRTFGDVETNYRTTIARKFLPTNRYSAMQAVSKATITGYKRGGTKIDHIELARFHMDQFKKENERIGVLEGNEMYDHLKVLINYYDSHENFAEAKKVLITTYETKYKNVEPPASASTDEPLSKKRKTRSYYADPEYDPDIDGSEEEDDDPQQIMATHTPTATVIENRASQFIATFKIKQETLDSLF